MSRKLCSITWYESKKNKNLIATENESVQDKLNNQKVENADFILISISSGSKSHEEHKY